MNVAVISGKVVGEVRSRPVNKTSVTNLAIIHADGKKTSLIKCEGWGDIAQNLNALQAGQEITVAGKLIEEQYKNKQGQEVRNIKVRVSSFSIGAVAGPDAEQQPQAVPTPAPAPAAVGMSDGQYDDIPF